MIEYVITEDQAALICKHFNVPVRNATDELLVSELLDKYIDELVEI